MKKLFYIFLFLIISATAFAADHYFDATDGSDSGAGTSGDPWQTISKAETECTSGDTCYFASEETWTGTVPTFTTAEGVTYDGSTYGSGTRATITPTDASGTVGTIMIEADDVIFTGFKIDGNQINVGGIYIGRNNVSAIDNITVENCVIYDQGQPTGNTSMHWMYGILVGARGGSSVVNTNIEVIDCVVHHTYHEGIAIYPSWDNINQNGCGVDNVLVRGCEIYDNGTDNNGEFNSGNGLGVAINNNSDNVTLEFCEIYDTNDVTPGQIHGISFRDSLDAGTSNGMPNNSIVRYNIIYSNRSMGILFQSFFGQEQTGDFYSNIIYNNDNSELSFQNGHWSDTTVLNFYNNTLFNSSEVTVDAATVGGNIFGNPAFNFKNNIFNTGGDIAIYDRHGVLNRLGALTHSYNMIYRSDGSGNTHASAPVLDSTPITDVEVTVSQDATYIYFTKSSGGDWTSSFSVGNFVKWTGFTSTDLNGSLFYLYEVSANFLKVQKNGSYTTYSDVNTVSGEKWVENTYDRTEITDWEDSAQNTAPTFTGGTLPTGFSGTYGTDMVPNQTYFSISSGDALDNGVTLGSPYNSCINGAGLSTLLLRPTEAYDIGAYEYETYSIIPTIKGVTIN